MSSPVGGRLVVVLSVPAPPQSPVPGVSRDRLAAALLADAVDTAESLAATGIAVLCEPAVAESIAAVAAIDTTVWASPQPTVASAASRSVAVGADRVVVLAADAPQLPGLLIGKVFRALGRADVAVCPDPRGVACAIGLRLPVPDWVGDVDLDLADLAETLTGRAPRSALVRKTPGWRRLREPADFATLDSAVEGADLTRALLA